MNTEYYSKLREIHRVNRVLWIALLSGMGILVLTAALFRFGGLLETAVPTAGSRTDNIILVITLALLFIVFYLKRHYLVPAKIVARARKKKIAAGSGDIAGFIAEFGEEVAVIAYALIIMRRYFMLVWSIANIILLLGFIVFIAAGQFQTFLIYAVISAYSMGINFPSFRIIEQCTSLSEENEATA